MPALGLVVSGLVWNAAALAEEAPRKRLGRYHVGPFYLTPRLEVRNAGVDTNVFNQPADPIRDTLVVVRPALKGALPIGRRVRLMGEGWVDLNYFREQRSERSADFGGRGRIELETRRLALFAAGGGDRGRQRFWLDLDQRALRQEKWGSIGLTLKLGRRISSTASATSRTYRFGSERGDSLQLKETLDRDEVTGTLQLRCALSARTTLTGLAERIDDRFVSQRGDNPRRVQSVRYLAGFELGERALLSGKALVGLRVFPRGESAAAPPYRGLASSVAVTLPVERLARVVLTADRDVFYAYEWAIRDGRTLRNSYVLSRLRAETTFGLPLHLIARGSVSLDQLKFVLPVTSGGATFQRADRIESASGSLLRAVTDSLRVGGSITWVRRVTNRPGYAFEGLRYGLQAELVP